MKLLAFAYIIVMATCPAAPNHAITVKDSAVLFSGTTPCNNIIRSLHKITREGDCAWNECHCTMVEWRLMLYMDPVTRQPIRYQLSSINRYIIKETNMFSQPGTKAQSEGKWKIIRGSKTNPDAIVYQLNPDKPEISLNFLKLHDNLLHLLDNDGTLMIGNEFWSYTLSRIVN